MTTGINFYCKVDINAFVLSQSHCKNLKWFHHFQFIFKDGGKDCKNGASKQKYRIFMPEPRSISQCTVHKLYIEDKSKLLARGSGWQ